MGEQVDVLDDGAVLLGEQGDLLVEGGQPGLGARQYLLDLLLGCRDGPLGHDGCGFGRIQILI